jgi:CheY-like chemotaxis protein
LQRLPHHEEERVGALHRTLECTVEAKCLLSRYRLKSVWPLLRLPPHNEPPSARASDKLATILCIDDDRDTLDVRKKVLLSSGYCVLTSQSGSEGLEVVSSGTPVDLVVLDYVMPGMNGDQVAESLKSNFPHLPVIAVSAVRLPPRMLEIVDAYVQKGQDVEVLLSTIERVLSPTAAVPQHESLTRRIVLCADDEIEELTARKMVLESAGFKVLVARNGKDALDVFRSTAVDAVVLDYFMPGMTGLSVAREMKELRPEVPLVMLSGFASLPGETIGVVDAWVQKRDVEVLLRELEKLIQLKTAAPPAR